MRLAIAVIGLVASTATAAPLADASRLDCDVVGCTLATVTDAAKAVLDARTDRATLMLTFTATTEAQLATMAKVPWVKRIRIDHMAIVDLAILTAAPDLEELALVRMTPGDLGPLAKLGKLRHLQLEVDTDPNLSVLHDLHALRELMITCRNAPCVAAAAGLVDLTQLWLMIEPAKSVELRAFTSLRRLTHLEDLMLFNTPLHDLALLEPLVALRKLSLEANRSLADVSVLKGLLKLTELTIAMGNPVKDAKVLFELPNLTSLLVEPGVLSDKDRARLKALRPKLTLY